MAVNHSAGYDYLPDRLPARLRREVRITDRFEGSPSIGGCGEDVNLTHGRLPALATRAPRGLLAKTVGVGEPRGMAIFDGCLYFVGGRVLYRWDGEKIYGLGVLPAGTKQLAVFGGRLYIYPDKQYVEAGEDVIRSMELTDGDVLTAVFKGNTVTLPEGETWTGLGFSAGDSLRVVNADDDMPAPEGYYHIERLNGRVATLWERFPATYESTACFRRLIPDLERVCVSGDRIYGVAGKEIYISAAGSATDFYSSGDSEGRSAACLRMETEGALTACAAWQGYVVFFKADRICKLLGTRSDTFTLQERPALGITPRLADTLCEVGGDLYYVSESGVCRYRGQEPELISSVGEAGAIGGSGGTDGVAYYVSLQRGEDDWGMYCYRPDKGTWLAEDGIGACSMLYREGYLCILDTEGNLWLTASDRRIPDCPRDETQLKAPVRAVFDLPPDYDLQPQGYRPVELCIRATARGDGTLVLLADYADSRTQKDADGSAPITLTTLSAPMTNRLLRIPLPQIPCDSLHLRLILTGDWTVHSIIREYERLGQ